MADAVDIKPLPGAGVYQLFLPEQVASTLQLTAADGHALSIIHENKMQLEWLGQRIWEQYHSLKNAFMIGKERLKRKKRIAATHAGLCRPDRPFQRRNRPAYANQYSLYQYLRLRHWNHLLPAAIEILRERDVHCR